ncbi:bestrophin-like domain [Neoroseomonas soli]|uniref:bestrophin-like domain n=1 Tax=Neoroseomonas soli TaxID=1081025 RepID=UPI0030B9BBFC
MLFVLQLLSREIGHWLGRRTAVSGAGEPEGVGVIVGGMLGLLAFVLALTLSFSSARFQERRDGTLAEANAIGTAWLRAVAIDHPRSAEVARLLEAYVPVRRDFVQAPLDTGRIAAIQARSDALQGEMWGHVSALVRERPDPVAASLMAAVNDVIDQSAAERLAFVTGMPPTLFWLLIGMTFATMAGLGYQLGLRGMRLRLISLVLITMWTVVMTAILDLGSPRLGSVRTSAAPYDWTMQGFAGGNRIPPLPAAR